MNRIRLRLGFSSFIIMLLIIIWLIIIDNATSLTVASPNISSSSIQNNDTNSLTMQQAAGINHTMNNTYDDTMDNNNNEEEGVSDGKLVSLETTPFNSTSYPSFSGVTNKSCVNYDSVNRTIYLCGGSTSLSNINRKINSSDALNNTSDKNWILNANISIANNATLFINSTDTQWLRINSTAPQPFSIVAYGNLVINGTRISSWNSTSNTEAVLKNDTNESTPRSYLLMPQQGTGHMNITNSNISGLGFKSLKDTWGITYYSGSGSTIENNIISSNFRGLHLAGNVSNILVANNTIQNSSQHGLDLLRAKDIKILENNVSNNFEHGIFCTRECEKILIKSNYISDNGKSGVVLNHATTDSVVEHNMMQDNNGSAIAIRNSSRSTVNNNFVDQNWIGAAVSQNSTYNSLIGNSITNSFSTGILVDSYSANNSIVKNLIQHSKGAGIYGHSSFENRFVGNKIIENSKSGVVFLNATKNTLVNNNLSANTPYNYYLRPNGTFNVLRDTLFENTTLRFFDNSSNIILESTNNRIINNNKEFPIDAYSTNATVTIQPVNKNILVTTLDMFAIPSADKVQIFSIDKDFNTNQTNKNWFEKSPQLSVLSEDKMTSTKYIIGSFPPNTQITIRTNDTFWNAYTSNASGYVTFVYDGYGEAIKAAAGKLPYVIIEFQAEVSNRPTMAAIIFFAALIAGSIIFIVIRGYMKRLK
ncbi:MAG TPA: right-handed parallel beta-helix repeat-containing protein, partial [Nitrososphaeraceae archaeon]|nr:right-handed parallel beta-helix repeat-containing protein [Nitrososphaeraceae archaeon]